MSRDIESGKEKLIPMNDVFDRIENLIGDMNDD
jgi:hypothetical protein